MSDTPTNPDQLSKTVFMLTAGGALAFFALVAIFVLRS
jgi:hypothetical protein